MRNKVIKPLLIIVCLLSSIDVSAYDFEVDGIYYDVVSLSEFTCEVVGKPGGKYSGDVVIPAHVSYSNKTLTVLGIANKVFTECSELTGITIPNTINSIGNEMFTGCSKLERVKIEDGKTALTVGNSYIMSAWGTLPLFSSCPVKWLYVGRNLLCTLEDEPPFKYIDTLKELVIGDSVTEIGSYAFKGCTGLTSVTIPNSVTEIGKSAFYKCTGLTSVTIPNSVTKIGDEAFCVLINPFQTTTNTYEQLNLNY